MQETWKTIKDYKNYEISNFGRVRNKQTLRILKPQENKQGYLRIGLYNGGKQKYFRIHRLVAEAFIANPNNFPQINHKDECKQNNHVSNLEWCSASYNSNYGTRTQKISKQVICVETGQIFASIMDVQRKKGYRNSNISNVCKGKRKTAGGYHWKYA